MTLTPDVDAMIFEALNRTTTMSPRAVFAFHQPDFDGIGPGFAMFHILGGPSDKSTVSAGTLRDLGIAVPVAA